MHIFCNNSDGLPQNLVESLEINGFHLIPYDPFHLTSKSFYYDKTEIKAEAQIVLCYVDYVHITEATQFAFLTDKKHYIPNIKYVLILNDFENDLPDLYNLPNLADIHYLSEPCLGLVQKMKLIQNNYKNHLVWGSKVLVLDPDITSLKYFHLIFERLNYLTYCCASLQEAKKYFSTQIKLVILAEKFSLDQNLYDFLEKSGYNRCKICIVNEGSNEIINQVKAKGIHIIFERPLKLESFIQIIKENLVAHTTTFQKTNHHEPYFMLPLDSLSSNETEDIKKLKVAENYYAHTDDIDNEKDETLIAKEGDTISHQLLKTLQNALISSLEHNVEGSDLKDSTNHIRVKKDSQLIQFAKQRLEWLVSNLFVYISDLKYFPTKYPDIWFPLFQKDIEKAFKKNSVLIYMLTFDLNNQRKIIDLCLNTAIIASLIYTNSIQDEYGDWPENLEEEWPHLIQNHKNLIFLSLLSRIDLISDLLQFDEKQVNDLLDLEPNEANLLRNFAWISPYEETFPQIELARIIKIAHKFLSYTTGVYGTNYQDEALDLKTTSFNMLFLNIHNHFRESDIKKLMFLMKQHKMWQLFDTVQKIKEYKCHLAKPLQNKFGNIKIECKNHQRAPEFQHQGFCKGCHTPYYLSDFDRKAYFCRSGNEALYELNQEIFEDKRDLDAHFLEDDRIEKRNSLL